jgi:uncharacterized protein YqgC (DUF456 family)
MVEGLLVFLGIVLLLLGVIGAFLPVLPGPPLGFLGLVVFSFLSRVEITSDELMIFGVVALLVTLLDYWFPIYGAKRTGGSKRGMWGAAIGLVLGMFFFPPLGIVVGPFMGALLGEFSLGRPAKIALKSAFGSLLGLLAGVLVKFFYAVATVVFVVIKVF